MVDWDLTKDFPRPSTGPHADSLPKAICKCVHKTLFTQPFTYDTYVFMYVNPSEYTSVRRAHLSSLVPPHWSLWNTTSGPMMGPANSHHQVKHHTSYLPGMLNEIYSLKGLGLDINKDEVLCSKAKDGKFWYLYRG